MNGRTGVILAVLGAGLFLMAAPAQIKADDYRIDRTDALIQKLLTNRDDDDRQSAAKELGKIGDSQAVLTALEYASRHDEEKDVRREAEKAANRVRGRMLADQLTACDTTVQTTYTSSVVVQPECTPTVIVQRPVYVEPPCPPPVVVLRRPVYVEPPCPRVIVAAPIHREIIIGRPHVEYRREIIPERGHSRRCLLQAFDSLGSPGNPRRPRPLHPEGRTKSLAAPSAHSTNHRPRTHARGRFRYGGQNTPLRTATEASRWHPTP